MGIEKEVLVVREVRPLEGEEYQQAIEDINLASRWNPVVLESPWQNGLERNKVYLQRCIADSLSRGEAPVASHRMYTEVWDDANPEQREQGMAAGWRFLLTVNKQVVYTDYGITPGMERGMNIATALHMFVEYRQIGVNPE